MTGSMRRTTARATEPAGRGPSRAPSGLPVLAYAPGMGESNRLGEFLRARRELVSPEEAGLSIRTKGRRVPGLRREEVAALTGISVEYLTRLERGKDSSPSRQVLDALAATLRLEDEAVRHLHSLVWPVAVQPPTVSADQPVPALARALMRFDGEISYILGPYFDVIACSAVADAFLGRAGHGNQLEYVFLDREAPSTYPDWDAVALEAVAALRSMARGREGDQRLHSLLGRLSAGSDAFRQLWARHDVHGHSSGTKRISSHRFGTITVLWDAFMTAYPTAQTLVLYTADPSTDTETILDAVRRSVTV
ncbi:transcriptional regulator [Kineosporia sp. NBRC 101731]|nr:transcriptional regulator [Kineosporia sp. NBRC 101731]